MIRGSSNKVITIYNKTKGRCWYCGKELNGDFQIDHANPRNHGGSNNIDNLLPSCKTCNRRKCGRTVEEYREYLYWRKALRFTPDQEMLLAENGIKLENLIVHPIVFYGELSFIEEDKDEAG